MIINRQEHRVRIANLLVQITFGLMAMTICLPSMQEWGELFRASQPTVQLTFGLYVLAYGGSQLLYGPLSDRFGRKPVLLTGLFFAIVGAILAVFAQDIATLIIARIIQGAGSAAGIVIGRAQVQDFFVGPDRTRIMAYVGMALGMTPPLAIIIGGALHEWLGWRTNFVLVALLAIGLFISASRLDPSEQSQPVIKRHWIAEMMAAYLALVKQPGFVLYVLLLGCTTATFYVYLSGAPMILKSYGIGPAGIGWVVMVCPLFYILGNFLTSRHVHQLGEHRIMQIGQWLSIAGVALMFALNSLGGNLLVAFILPMVLVGLGHGFLVPPTLTATVGLNQSLAGAAAGIAGLAQQGIGAFGGFTVSLVTHEDAMNASLLMLVFTLIGAFAFLSIRSQK